MDNVPVRVNGSTATGRSAAPPSSSEPGKNRKRFKLAGVVVGGLALLAVVLTAGWLVYQSSMASAIDNGRYQAVFFTNGQVYFGKLQNLNGSYFKLTDVFYLQTKTNDASKNPQETSAQDANNVELVKLGSEIHGPEDEMIVSKDQVLFFENLKKDGKVSDSITKYLDQKK